jgi:citrate synthase
MAIPGWIWPDNTARNENIQSSITFSEASEIDSVTSVFEVLSNTNRLEILASLHRQSGPISYTELRESTSVDDKGQFNYHLRQLEQLVRNQNGKYTLTEHGEELIQSVLSEDQIFQHE